MKYNIKSNYNPSRCDGFCPYHEECLHTKNILETVIPKHNTIDKIESYNNLYYSLDEAQDDTYNAILKAFRAEDDSIYVIDPPTKS